MLPYRLEAHGQEMVRRQQTGGLLPAGVPECLYGLEAPAQQILGHRLHQHPAEPLPLIAGLDEGRDQLDGVR